MEIHGNASVKGTKPLHTLILTNYNFDLRGQVPETEMDLQTFDFKEIHLKWRQMSDSLRAYIS